MNSEMTFIIIIRLTQVQLNMAGTELKWVTIREKPFDPIAD